LGLLNVNASSSWSLVIVFGCHENEVGTRIVPFRLEVEMAVTQEKAAVFITFQAAS
jgi:hypothetical protein